MMALSMRSVYMISTIFLLLQFGNSQIVLSQEKPNVIFILSDDVGYGDLQTYGNPFVETPNINTLASEGIKFTNYYSPSSLCAPARAGLLTGRYNHRTGAVDVSSNRGIDRIALSEKTMGDYFKHAGYKTALIGKWHNGVYNDAYLPYNRGFDSFYGFANGGQDYYKWNLMKNGRKIKHDGRYLTNVFTQEAVKFIMRNKEKPFFLFLSYNAPHPPLEAPDSLIAKYEQMINNQYSKQAAQIYAMIEVMDMGVGHILATLNTLNLRGNTIVVFASDNGAHYFSKKQPRYEGSFAGEKGNVLEQGIRVPAIISWEGMLGEDKTINVPIHGIDWLPTLFSVANSGAPKNSKKLDGINIMPFLEGKVTKLRNRCLFFQKNRYTPVAHSDASIRCGKWKLYWPRVSKTMEKNASRDSPAYKRGIIKPYWEMPLDPSLPKYNNVITLAPELFNLFKDPSERYNVASKHPLLVQKIKNKYNKWFGNVMQDWKDSWQEIKKQDKSYWENRKAPNARKLFKGFWRWDQVEADSSNTDPLKVFKGYWNRTTTEARQSLEEK